MNLLLVGDFSADAQAAWAQALRQALPGHRLHTVDELPAGPDIEVAIVANPPPGSLQGLPRLRLIQSLWAGVDRLLDDPTLPLAVPVARMVDSAMCNAMAETALWAALALHRGFFRYAQQQQGGQWLQQPQTRAGDNPVLVLGWGQMGQAVARRLVQQGYPVSAWRRGDAAVDIAADAATAPPALAPSDGVAKAIGAIRLLDGSEALAAARSQARVVINLLPLTQHTRGLIDARWLAGLPRGAGLVNLARGAHLVDADLLAALDAGHIGHAVLDVFHTEPLPAEHRFWRHPQVTVLPHAAALTDLRSAARVVARNIQALAAGAPLQGLVVPGRGY